MVRPAAARLEAGLALGPVAAPPLAQGRARDPAPSADEAGVAGLLVEPDPAEPRSRIHRSSPRAAGKNVPDDASRRPRTIPQPLQPPPSTIRRSGPAIAGRHRPREAKRSLRTPH